MVSETINEPRFSCYPSRSCKYYRPEKNKPLKQRRCAFSGLVLKYRNRLGNSIPSTHSASTFQWPLDHHWTNFVQSEGKRMKKCEKVNDLGITVKSAFTPSANALTAANKAKEMLYFIKRSFTCLTKETFVPLHSTLVRPHLEYAIQANSPNLNKRTPPRKNTTGSNKVGERSKRP